MAQLTTQQVKQIVRQEVQRGLQIHPSDTIHVAAGDHPMQPSVIPGSLGGLIVTGGDGIDIDSLDVVSVDLTSGGGLEFQGGQLAINYGLDGISVNGLNELHVVTSEQFGGTTITTAGAVGLGDFSLMAGLLDSLDNDDLYIAVWHDDPVGTPAIGHLRVSDLPVLVNNPSATSVGTDSISFYDLTATANRTSTIADFFADNTGSIDHGGLAGLTDDDHVGYLLIDGTRAMTGDLTLPSNVVLNVTSTTQIQIEMGFASVFTLTTTALSMAADTLTLDTGGTDNILITGSTGSTPRHLTIQAPGSGVGGAGDLVLKAGGGAVAASNVHIQDDLGNDYLRTNIGGSSLQLLVNTDITGTLDVTGITTLDVTNIGDDLTVTGGDINLATASTQKITFGDGDTYFYELADDVFALYVGGALNFVAVAAATTFSQDMVMASGKTFDLNGVATITGDANANSLFWSSADDIWDWSCGGGATGVMQLTATVLDGTGALTLTGFGGRRATFDGSYRLTSTANNKPADPAGLCWTGANQGWPMLRSGSIVGIGITLDINAISGADPVAIAYINNVKEVGCTAVIASPVVGNGQMKDEVFANGVHTFAAGDRILVYRQITTGTITTDDFQITLEVEYDN